MRLVYRRLHVNPKKAQGIGKDGAEPRAPGRQRGRVDVVGYGVRTLLGLLVLLLLVLHCFIKSRWEVVGVGETGSKEGCASSSKKGEESSDRVDTAARRRRSTETRDGERGMRDFTGDEGKSFALQR